LRTHTPASYGPQEVTDILSDSAVSVASEYFLHLCFATSLIDLDDQERKLGSFWGTNEWPLIEQFANELECIGVQDSGDVSVLHWRSPERVMLIDFAPTNQ
jgi:hypothetical protein